MTKDFTNTITKAHNKRYESNRQDLEFNNGHVLLDGWHALFWIGEEMQSIKSINSSVAAGKRWEKHCSISAAFQSVLDGLMISDGFIHRGNYHSSFKLASKHLEFVEHLQALFAQENIESKISINHAKLTDKDYYTISTTSYTELSQQHDRWYKNDKKIIPNDILVNNNFMLYWYLGDGTKKKWQAEFGTYAYTISDVKNLCWKICEAYKYYPTEVRIYIVKKDGPIVSLATSVTPNFLEAIGPSPVRCFDYKFIHENLSRGKNLLLEDRWNG